MTHGSLFSGIGGFDLAAEWMGWENKFHCEWNPFGQKVLHHYWPNSEQFTDITKSDFTKYANKIDILTGGFHCQPYSSAGKRLGKEDDRHLWPQMLRAIQEIQPRWIVGENVRGLTNWNGGMVFDEVQVDLEAQGYEVTPFLLPACAVNAPHRRDRIWFVAYSGYSTNSGNNGKISRTTENKNKSRIEHRTTSEQQIQLPIISNIIFGNVADSKCSGLEYRYKTGNISSDKGEALGERSEFTNEFKADGNGKFNVADTESFNLQNKWNEQRSMGEKNNGQSTRGFKYGDLQTNWSTFPTSEPTICNGNDGLPDRLDGITFSKWRNESIKAGGNAIVPQVVHQIFKAIQEYERIRVTNKD